MFDRLLFEIRGDDPQGFEAMAESIARSLAALISVRAPVEARGLRPAERTILDYGVDAIEDAQVSRKEDRLRYAEEVLSAVRAFEPRIDNPEVCLSPDPKGERAAVITVTGDIQIGQMRQAFRFDERLTSEAMDQ